MPGFTMMPAARGLLEQGASGGLVTSYIAGLQRKSLERELAALRQEFAMQQQQQQQAASEEHHLAAIAAKVAELEAAAAAAAQKERRLQEAEAHNRDLQEQLEQQQAASEERFLAAMAAKDAELAAAHAAAAAKDRQLQAAHAAAAAKDRQLQAAKAAAAEKDQQLAAAKAAAIEQEQQLQAARAAAACNQQQLQKLANMAQQLAAANAAAAEKEQQLQATKARNKAMKQQHDKQQEEIVLLREQQKRLADNCQAMHKQAQVSLAKAARAAAATSSIRRDYEQQHWALECTLRELESLRAAHKALFANMQEDALATAARAAAATSSIRKEYEEMHWALECTLRELDNLKAARKAESSAAAASMYNSSSCAASVQALRAQLQEMTAENTILRTEAAENSKFITTLQADVAVLQEDLDKREDSITVLLGGIADATKLSEGLLQENQQLRAQLAAGQGSSPSFSAAPEWLEAGEQQDWMSRRDQVLAAMEQDVNLQKNVPGTPGMFLLEGAVQGYPKNILKRLHSSLCVMFHPDKPGGSCKQQAGVNEAWAAVCKGKFA